MRNPHVWSLLGVHVPNVLPKTIFGLHVPWLRKLGRLIWSSLMLVGGCAVAFVWTRRPKRSNEPSTWAQAILGAMLVWALMTLAFGAVPHEWLTFANSYLQWTSGAFLVRHGQFLNGRFPPFSISKAAVADAVATVVYVVFIGVYILLFAAWQKRKVAEPAAEGEHALPAPPTGPFARFGRRAKRVSAYGRPVTTPE